MTAPVEQEPDDYSQPLSVTGCLAFFAVGLAFMAVAITLGWALDALF